MVATLDSTYSPEEQSVMFFRELKRVLGIPSTKALVRLVNNVLTHIQRGLSTEQTRHLVSLLPGHLKMLAQEKLYQPDQREGKSFSYLDELAEELYSNDRRSGKPVFMTEVHALNAAVVVLKKLDKLLNLFSYNFLKFPLVQSIRQIPVEEAI